MLDAGCPVGRHELTNDEWLALGVLKNERERISYEEMKEKYGETRE